MRKNVSGKNYLRWDIVRLCNKAGKVLHPQFVKQRLRRGLGRLRKREGLRYISLSLSSACSADCIYCPANRGESIKTKMMPFESVEKITQEITSRHFQRMHNIESISISTNGDAFLNKDVIKILRFLKRKVPEIKKVCFTNFRAFTKEKIDIVLREGLIDFMGCNIDGSTPESYYSVKKADYNKVREHLLYFIEMRKKLWRDMPLMMSITTFYAYVSSIRKGLGIYPSRAGDVDIENLSDDFQQTRDQYKDLLDHPKDHILKTGVRGWAERHQIDPSTIDYSHYNCPILDRVKQTAYIAPDGSWWSCCWDGNNEIIFGNVIDTSIHDVFLSQKRKRFFELLENRKFKEIGSPCETVNCCQEFGC